jgi:hypothetical protein
MSGRLLSCGDHLLLQHVLQQAVSLDAVCTAFLTHVVVILVTFSVLNVTKRPQICTS